MLAPCANKAEFGTKPRHRQACALRTPETGTRVCGFLQWRKPKLRSAKANFKLSGSNLWPSSVSLFGDVLVWVQQPPQLWFLCWLRLEEHYEAIKCFARFVYSWHLLPVAGAHFSQTHGCQKGLNKICQSKLQGVVHRKRKQFKQLVISAGPARVGFLLRRAVKRWCVWLIWCASC